ncbi:MAG: DEAD/DEAH box helicase [Nitrososphaeraceae archaeon]
MVLTAPKLLSNYRCPNCGSLTSVVASRIYSGGLIFVCGRCSICGVVRSIDNQDEAYLEFLDMYDNGQTSKLQDLESLRDQEKFLRPTSEIDSLLYCNHAKENELLKTILYSKKDYIVDFRVFQESTPETGGELELLPLDEGILEALSAKNIKKLYKFQEESIKQVLRGKDVVIVAPTASGKTEAFCIPIIQKISEEIPHFSSLRSKNIRGNEKVFAVFVYPTKALARDQLPKIRQIAANLGINVNIFDGDTTMVDRDSIITTSVPEIIITNFDVIHYHLLNRTRFSRIIKTARFLVVDEAHVYTGVFGANIHHVIKRFQRLTNSSRHRGKLQIIAASATLSNAKEFCKQLFDREMDLIYGTGRKGRINFVIMFPSLHSQRSLILDLLKQTTTRKHKTIAFSKSHLSSELLAFYSSKQGISIKVHRAGLLATVRKSVEESFKNGKLMAISATPTLELGIDIGDVDVVISDIVPVNRLIQRLGRAARSGQEGYAFLALGNDPISQYYKLHPDDYLQDQEFAYTDPSNPFVEEYQVLAMACDKPISISESPSIITILDRLISKDLVRLSNSVFVPNFKKAMEVLREFNIRGIGTRVGIFYNGKLIGERQMPQAIEELHDNAVYFLAGRRYHVQKLHFRNGKQNSRMQEQQEQLQQQSVPYAELKSIPNDYPYYTRAIVNEFPTILEIHDQKMSYGLEVKYCSLRIQKKVIGYSNVEVGKEALQGTKIMLENPIEFEFISKGLVFKAPIPESVAKSAQDEQYVEMSGYHASEHVIIEGSSMITGGASQDLGGISLGSTGSIFIYDGSVGGNGASRVLYDKFDKAIARALTILSDCPCMSESGCPRCTYSYRCGNNNEYLHKASATEILNRIVNGEQTRIGDTTIIDKPLV